MSLATNLQNLAIRVATECKALRLLINGNAANLNALNTSNKSNLVAAINEVLAAISGAAGINDGATGAGSTWSSTKIVTEITAARNAIINGSGAALDTLLELSAAIANDPNFAASMATSLANRVRVDAVQVFTDPQKAQALANIGAVASADVGDVNTNFVTIFEAGLV